MPTSDGLRKLIEHIGDRGELLKAINDAQALANDDDPPITDRQLKNWLYRRFPLYGRVYVIAGCGRLGIRPAQAATICPDLLTALALMAAIPLIKEPAE
jgi:hypothetical protein